MISSVNYRSHKENRFKSKSSNYSPNALPSWLLKTVIKVVLSGRLQVGIGDIDEHRILNNLWWNCNHNFNDDKLYIRYSVGQSENPAVLANGSWYSTSIFILDVCPYIRVPCRNIPGSRIDSLECPTEDISTIKTIDGWRSDCRDSLDASHKSYTGRPPCMIIKFLPLLIHRNKNRPTRNKI